MLYVENPWCPRTGLLWLYNSTPIQFDRKSCFFEWKKHWISSHYDKIQKIFNIRGQCKIQINDNNDDYCKLLIQIIIAHDEVNVHCSPAKEVFFHNSQLDNERLLEKSQNPREIRTCSLPIARHKRWPLCHRDVIEQSWTVEYIRMRLNMYDLYIYNVELSLIYIYNVELTLIYIQRRAIFKIIDVFVMCCEAPLRLCV